MESTRHSTSSSHQWQRKNCIGQGSFGKVHIAINKANHQVFAVKSVNTKTALPSHIEALENEIQILQYLSSPYVVGYLGNDLTHESSSEVHRNLHMEYMYGGTVIDGGSKGEKTVQAYTRCILKALDYLHTKGIVHCDVKGRNVLVAGCSNPGVAKLADFGSAKRFSTFGEDEVMNKFQGTPLWMAPEVIQQEKQGPESDVWSLGCTVIEMITGKPEWNWIGFSDELPEFPAQLSESGRDFVDKCLRREPSERWTCEKLLQHPFVSESDIIFESSPRSVLDWASSEFHDDEESEEGFQFSPNSSSAEGRIGELASGRGAIWESDGWEVVRSSSECNRGETECSGDERNGINSEYSEVGSSAVGKRDGINSEFNDFISVQVENEDSRSLEYLSSGGSWATMYCWCWCGFKAGLGCQHGLIKINSVALKNQKKDICCKTFLLFLLLRFFHSLEYQFHLLFYSRLLISFANTQYTTILIGIKHSQSRPSFIRGSLVTTKLP